jgi:hypothetical protein
MSATTRHRLCLIIDSGAALGSFQYHAIGFIRLKHKQLPSPAIGFIRLRHIPICSALGIFTYHAVSFKTCAVPT